MAITYIVGIPRSGKSYYAVYNIWKNFVFKPNTKGILAKSSKLLSKETHKNIDYKYCYTNINQFDFSKSPKLKKFDKDTFKHYISEIYYLYQQKKPDEELVQKAKELNLYKVLIVLDESHNILTTKPDPIYVWWLTYHGHLYQDIILITQDMSLTSPEYKKIAEFFYKAVPPSNRLSHKKFRYVQYSSPRLFQNSIVGDFTIPALKDVFNMYVSGQKNTSKSKVTKYIYIVAFLIILLIYLSYSFLQNIIKDKIPETNTTKPSNFQEFEQQKYLPIPKTNQIQTISTNDILNDKTLVAINCFGNDCTIKGNQISFKALKYLIQETNTTILDKSVIGANVKFYLLAKDQFIAIFQKKVSNNEQIKNSSATAPSFNLFNSNKPK
jgi:zona occludens toxin